MRLFTAFVCLHIRAELNLSHNKITTLHEQLSDLSHLRVLNMAHNKLSMVPFAAAKMPALEELDLSNNRIDSKCQMKGGGGGHEL